MSVASAWTQTDRLYCIHIYEIFGFKPVRIMSLMKRSLVGSLEIKISKATDLREAELGHDQEIALINRLENEAFKEHFNFRPVSVEETRYMLFEMPWFQGQKAYFAVDSGQPVGYVITGIDEGLNKEKGINYGWILDIGVLKTVRRRKIGSTLMLKAMQTLKSQGMETALLYVDDQNPTGAIKLYESVDFAVFHKSNVYELSFA
jgi:mycothiol synthase